MSLRRNVIANYLGQAWAGFMAVAFIPVYVKHLGIEAYGLVGIFALLQTGMSLLDAGMTPTFSREMARYMAGARSLQSTLNLLRSLETIYLLLGIFVAGTIWLVAPLLATRWLSAQQLPVHVVVNSLVVMGIVVALRAWESVYRGAVQGAQKQVWLNAVQACMATLRWGGVACVLLWMPTIDAYLIWQGVISALTVAIFAAQTYRVLPSAERRARFSLSALKDVAGFSGGLAVSALLSLALTQSDKLILSKLFTLKVFGYYTLAAMVANSLWLLVYPMSYALYPRLSEFVARNDTEGVARTYMSASQWLSLLIVPPALVVAVFAKTVLVVWSGDLALATQVAPIVRLLILGNLLNGVINPPVNLQLAYGWPQLSVKANFVALCILLPAMFFFVPTYGPIGAASIWLILNFGMLFMVQVMHRRLLPDRKWEWYRTVVAYPLLAGGSATAAMAAIMPFTTQRLFGLFLLLVAGAFASLAVAWSMKAPRGFLLMLLQKGRSRFFVRSLPPM